MPTRPFRQQREQHTFAWGQSNLDATTPRELQDRGLNVYFSPGVPSEARVVDLDDGHIEIFHEGEARPDHGWFADLDSLTRYCEAHGLPLEEVNGFAILQPHGSGTAGSSLVHGRPADEQ